MGLSNLRVGTLAKVLIPVFLFGLYIFLSRNGYIGGHKAMETPAPSPPELAKNPKFMASQRTEAPLPKDKLAHHPSAKETRKIIDNRISKIKDHRPQECRTQNLNTATRVSIIMDFSDYQFEEVKITISSVLYHTPLNLIEEIILVDDGSTDEQIIQDSKDYEAATHKIRVLRTGKEVGAGVARQQGADQATGQVLVFLETTIVCSPGWLQPLLDMLHKEPNSIAVPHFDHVKDPFNFIYTPTDNNLITTFTWSLVMRVLPDEDSPQSIKPINSPILRTNAFAMRKKFFKDIGGFDLEMQDMIYESMELSFRTWMCGGAIRVLPCSRIGVFNIYDSLKVVPRDSALRLAAVWFGDYRHYVYNILGIKEDPLIIKNKIEPRRKQITDTLKLKCENFDWFMKNVAINMVLPSPKSTFFGLLETTSGRCARMGTDNRLVMGLCDPDKYGVHKKDMFFEYSEKHLTLDGLCVAVQSNAHVLLEKCEEGELRQVWEYEPGYNLQLRNPWSKFCAMHVTDPDDPKADRQIIMAQNCEVFENKTKFISWKFLDA